MEIAELDESRLSQEKMGTRVALLEQAQESTTQSLLRIEKKLDIIEIRIEKAKREIYTNLRWILNLLIPTLLTVVSLSISLYQLLF